MRLLIQTLQKKLDGFVYQPGLSEQAQISKKIETVHDALDLYLSNPSFGVDELARDLRMSRTQLYRKFKALTNITQVALEVGIPNFAYFSKAFKKEVGRPPSKITS